MSDQAERFVAYLSDLKQRDSGAMAVLRHSLAFEPGSFPRVFPYVERFAGAATHERDARRLALYVVAGLFAKHPLQQPDTFAAAFGKLMRERSKPGEPNKSIESRFIAMLGADANNVAEYLRQAVSLLASGGWGFDYVRLLGDLTQWMNPNLDPNQLRQRWARDFYRAAQASNAE